MKIIGEVTKGLAALASASQAAPAQPRRALPAARRPRPVPVPAPAPVEEPPEQQQHFAEAETAVATVPPVVEKFLVLIRQRVDPMTVAQDFLATARSDEQLQEALAAVGNNPLDLFGPHLGSWIASDPTNPAYVRELVSALQQLMLEAQQGPAEEGEDEPTPVEALSEDEEDGGGEEEEAA